MGLLAIRVMLSVKYAVLGIVRQRQHMRISCPLKDRQKHIHFCIYTKYNRKTQRKKNYAT